MKDMYNLAGWCVEEDSRYSVFAYRQDAKNRIERIREEIKCGRVDDTHPRLVRMVRHDPAKEAVIRAAVKWLHWPEDDRDGHSPLVEAIERLEKKIKEAR